MPDIARIGSFSNGGRFVTELDVNDGTTYAFLRDTFKISAPNVKQNIASSERRYGGGMVASETHDNGTIEAEWYVKGATSDASIAAQETLLRKLSDTTSDRYFEWRPDGASRSVYYELRGPGNFEPMYRWIEFGSSKTIHVKGTFNVAPLALGAPMDIYDDFSINSISDYTFTAGAGTLSISNGQLVPSDTTEKRLYHSARGYSYGDAQATLKFTTDSTVTGEWVTFLKLKYLDDTNHLLIGLRRTGGTLYVVAYRVDSGTWTYLGGPSISDLSANTDYWIRGRIEGNSLFGELFTSTPTPQSAPAQSTTVDLGVSAGAVAKFGTGITGGVGLTVIPPSTGWRYDDFNVEAYSYRNRILPEIINLSGSIPGTAPARTAITVTETPAAAQPWALVAWGNRSITENKVWNGDFEEDTDGWAITGLTFNAAPNSASRVTTQKKFGIASMEVNTPATLGSGPEFKIYGLFKKGITYTATIWMRGVDGTSFFLRFGYSGNYLDSSAAASNGVWTQYTIDWTPTADRSYAVVAPRTNAANATTFYIDGAAVYSGSAPTTYPQLEGRGSYSPLSIIEAEASDTSDTTNFTIGSDGGSSGGQRMAWSTSGAGTAQLSYFFDPSLIPADDFTLQDLRMEVYARINYTNTHVNPMITLSARSAAGLSYGNERYTEEYGSAGKLLQPVSGACWRLVRLGIITLSTSLTNPARWKLILTAAVAAGSSGSFYVDYLLLVPAKQRASSPTQKVNDNTYPKFIPGTSETSKTITYDHRGFISKPPQPPFPDHGFGGQLLEFSPGAVNLLVTSSNLVPDDPTLNTTTETLGPTGTIHLAVQPRYFLARD